MNTFIKNNSLLVSIPKTIPAGSNSANWWNQANWDGLTNGNLTTVGTNGGPSFYGTYDQGGLLREPTEEYTSSGVYMHGGDWYSGTNARFRLIYFPAGVGLNFGFRIATYNNPNGYPNFVSVGDINNTAGSNGYGSVGYAYKINKYPTTYSEYLEFLSAVARNDSGVGTSAVYYGAMQGSTYKPNGLAQTASGSYVNGAYVVTYSYAIPDSRMANKPINYVGWKQAARYANWLHNGKPNSGSLTSSTTEDGAYDMTLTYPTRKPGAKYFIPTLNEWYKAGYYKGGSTNAGYWIYPTRSDVIPAPVRATTNGDATLPSIVLSNIGTDLHYSKTIATFGFSNTQALGFNTGSSSKLNLFSVLLSVSGGEPVLNQVSIYSDAGGMPGSLLTTSNKAVSHDNLRKTRFIFPSITLSPNTTYWVLRPNYTWFFVYNPDTNAIDTPVPLNNSGYSFVDVMVQSGGVWSSYTPNPGFLSYRNWGFSLETT